MIKTLLYIKFPVTRTANPISSIAIPDNLVFSQVYPGTVRVTIKPTAQIKIVLITSTTDLAVADTYFVTETPAILNDAIVIIPKITKTTNKGLCPIY